MVEIKIIEDSVVWNGLLTKTSNYNFTSTFEWGEYKKCRGWSVDRLAFYDSGNFLGMSALIYKKKFGFSLGWSNGGISVVNLSKLPLIVESIKSYLSKKGIRFYQRFSFFEAFNAEWDFNLNYCLKKSFCNINSDYTTVHYLSKELDLHKLLSSNHRYYLKQALKYDLKCNISSDLGAFLEIHNSMTKLKNIENLSINRNDLDYFLSCFKDKYKVICTYDKNGAPLSAAIVITLESKAYYYLAASNEAARNCYASYAMVFELLKYLQNSEFSEFNFMGLTPFKQNALGVNKFKIGFGGKLTKYLGEWEISNCKLLSRSFNAALLLRGQP